jgi:DNA-directed RNA polymerase subunit M/transcription elongation factor TFIIS
MDLLRATVLAKYKDIFPYDYKALEEETYKYSVERSGIDDNTQTYIQVYIKVMSNITRIISGAAGTAETLSGLEEFLKENNIAVIDLPRLDREIFCPEKWTTLRNKRTDTGPKKVNKGIHRCPKCKSWYTDYQQLQRASADESMCVSVVCLDCDFHWKYS